MLLRRRSRGIATIIGGVLLAVALLAIIALYFYLQNQQEQILDTLSQSAQTRLETSMLASSLDASYYYSWFTRTLYIEVTSSASRAVIITSLNIIWSNTSFTVIDRTLDLASLGVTATVTSLTGSTTTITRFPIVLGPGDTLDIVIRRATTPVTITLTLSASPAAVTIPVKPRQQVNQTNQTMPGTSLPQYSTMLLPEPLSGYIVAVRGGGIELEGPYISAPQGISIIAGQLVSGNLGNLLSRDGATLDIRSVRAPMCPGMESWRYMRIITIHNPNNYDYENIQVRIELDNSNFNFAHAKSDGSDIRILTTSCQPLDYWIEEWNPTQGRAVIWVKLPAIRANSDTKLLLVYGNPDARIDQAHYGLEKIMTRLPASDGPGYTIQYQEWKMPENLFTETGTPMNWRADDSYWRYRLPFNFPYYSTSYNTIYVASNGFISFGRGYTDWTSTDRELRSRKMIAPFWADLMTSTDQGNIYINPNYSDSFGEGIYIRWHTQFYYARGSQDFGLVLYRNGLIRFDYGTIRGSASTDRTQVVGVSFGDNRHYTIASYDYSKLRGYPSNYPSLLFWPLKKPENPFQVTIGNEESFNKYVVDVTFSYLSSPTLVKIINISLASLQPSGINYHYTIDVQAGSTTIAHIEGDSSTSLQDTIILNNTVMSPINLRLRILSDNQYILQIDQLALGYYRARILYNYVYVSSNTTNKLFVLNLANNNTAIIDLTHLGLPALGYTAIATEYTQQTPQIWIARGATAILYDVIHDTVIKTITLGTSLGPGGFIASNGSVLYYCPGGGTTTIYLYSEEDGALLGTLTTPIPITSWSSTAQTGSILYIHTGDTNHLLALNLVNTQITDLGPTPVLYPLGLDYDSSTNSLWTITLHGGIYYYNISRSTWGSVAIPLPFCPEGQGDRLATVNNTIYFIRGDGTSTVLILPLNQLCSG